MSPTQLIEAISWYRDHFHKIDMGHNDMIKKLRPLAVKKRLTAKDQELVDNLEQTMESWLDTVATVE